LDFPGCVIVVSHDRYFMDKVIDHLFVFKGEGEIDDFPGNYTDYRVYEDSQPLISNTSDDKKDKKSWKKTEDNKLTYNEEKELKNIESKLNSLAFDKKELETKFNNPDLSPDEINKLSKALQKIIDDLEAKEGRWLELQEKLIDG
jgi:ATP-binding cassette subfamily F protein uup